MSLATTSSLRGAHIRAFNARNVRRADLWILLCVCALAIIGFLVLLSANRSVSTTAPFHLKQAMFFVAGCGVALFVSCFDHRFLVSIAPLMYTVFLALLLCVLFIGVEVRGGQRWLHFGPFGFQPSEYTKLALVFTLAWYFTTIGRKIERLPYFLLAFAIGGLPAYLIFKQPDLGTAATLGPITVAMLYIAGCKRWHLAAIVVLALAVTPIAWSQLEDYQKKRIMTVVDPSADPQGSGYHTIQSMITVGSGGLTGKGYMVGTQTYLSYLPEHHTDFIFSLLSEEFGFVGSVTVLFLFLFLFFRGLRLARNSTDMAGSLLAVGVVTLLAFHVFVNVSITIGILPVTGLPLPFLSYGGSFYLTVMTSIGILLSVNARRGMFDYLEPPGTSSIYGYSWRRNERIHHKHQLS